MKISVIVPFCNTPLNMIAELIDQLSRLNNKDFEVIFVNDGSKNEVSNYVENKIANFKYIKFECNHGVSHARNEGIKIATGDYLFFVDSDDLIDIDLANLLPTLSHDDLSIFISDIFYTNINLNKNELNKIDIGKNLDEIYAKCNLKGIAMRSACGKIFKRSILVENSIYFDEELPFYEDALFVSQYYSFVKKFNVYSNVIYHYRMNEQSYSKKFNKHYMEKYKVFFTKYKDAFSNNSNYLFGLYSDAFNSVLVSKVVTSFKKFHYGLSTKICKNPCIVEAANYLLKNNLLYSKYKIKLASLIINGHNIIAANKIIFHQINGSLKIRLKRLFKH